MSKISELGEKNENLVSLLLRYESEIEEAEEHLRLEGKTLDKANRENPTWQVYYDQRRIELHTIVKYLELHVNRIRGKLFRQYTETHQRELSDRAKDKYIDNEKAYLDMHELLLEAKDTYEKYQAIVDAFQARGYALNNITRARIAEVSNTLI